MNSDLTSWFSLLFDKTVALLNSVNFPGTKWSILSLLLIVLSLNVVIFVLRFIFGLGLSVNSARQGYLRRMVSRGGNNRKIKIADNRKNDTR